MIEISLGQSTTTTSLRQTAVAPPKPRVVGQDLLSRLNASRPPSPFGQPSDFRAASVTRSFEVSLTVSSDGSAKDRATLEKDVLRQFQDIFGAFHGKGEVGAFIESALDGISDLIDEALESDDAFSFQFRIAGVQQVVGAADGSGAAVGSFNQLAVEIGLVKGDRVSAEDVRLVDLEGKRLELSLEERRVGVVSGLFVRGDKDGVPPLDKVRSDEVKAALERLRLVQDALKAFRKGDDSALKEIERLFRGGTLDSGAADALAQAKKTDAVVFPGSGVIGTRS